MRLRIVVGCGLAAAAWATQQCSTQQKAKAEGMPRLRVALVRHGESQNNVLNLQGKEYYREHRQCDPALTEEGQAQAQAVANFVMSRPPLLPEIHRLAVSPMLRTMMTIAPLAEALGVAPTVWPETYEAGGCWLGIEGRPGMDKAAMEARFPTYEAPAELEGRGWYDASLGVETPGHAEGRAQRTMEALRGVAAGLEGDENMMMITHFDFIDLVLRQAVGGHPTVKEVAPGALFQTYNCAISCFDVYADGSVKVLFTNRNEYMGDLVRAAALGLV